MCARKIESESMHRKLIYKQDLYIATPQFY